MKFLKLNFLFILLFSLAVMNCADHKLVIPDKERHFAFGRFYGECGGEQCIEFFSIDNDELFESTTDLYPNQDTHYTFSHYIKVSDEKYQLVKDLPSRIPSELYSVDEKVIGCPDCADGGGYYIETTFDGDLSYWYVDAQNVPDFLNEFITEMHEKIDRLNQ